MYFHHVWQTRGNKRGKYDMLQEIATNKAVERADIIGTVGKRLQNIKSKHPVDHPILNIHGISGMGKSWLIKKLAEEFRSKYAVVRLSFDVADKRDNRILSWREIITHLRRIPALEDLPIDVSAEGRSNLPSEGGVIHEIRELLFDQGPVLLLLDAMDDLADWKWVQEQIIKPLLEERQALVICTSQSPLFWHFWEVREQCEQILLPPLTLEETRAWLAKSRRELLAEAAHKLTQGYPLMLSKLIALLKQANKHDSDEQDDSEINLFQYEFSPEVEKVLLTIGVMRRIEIPLMEQVLQKFLPEYNENNRSILLLTLVAARGQKFFKSRTGTSDQFKSSLRKAVNKELFDSESGRKRYYDICAYLAEQYSQRVKEQPKTEVESLLEWLYFSTEVQDAESWEAESWEYELETLFHEVRQVWVISQELSVSSSPDSTLIALFHEDDELMNKLTPEQFDKVIAQMRNLLAGAGQQIPMATLFASACSDTFEEISSRLQPDTRMHTLKDQLESSIRFLAQDDAFDVDYLQTRIQPTESNPGDVSRRGITDDMMLLMSRGLLTYDRRERKYSVNSILRHAISATNTPSL
jgi:hypothetical protein